MVHYNHQLLDAHLEHEQQNDICFPLQIVLMCMPLEVEVLSHHQSMNVYKYVIEKQSPRAALFG